MKSQNYFEREEHNSLFELFKHDEFGIALAKKLEQKEYKTLEIIPHKHCIELSNSEICIAIIIFAGFETHDFNSLKYHHNLHLVSFCDILPEMLEFKNLKVKYVNRKELLFEIINISDDFYARALNKLIKLKL